MRTYTCDKNDVHITRQNLKTKALYKAVPTKTAVVFSSAGGIFFVTANRQAVWLTGSNQGASWDLTNANSLDESFQVTEFTGRISLEND